MNQQNPSVGRIVHYRLAEYDDPSRFNGCRVGDLVAAVVTRVWPDDDGLCNLQVIGDCASQLYPKTSVARGNENGQWRWPERV